MIDVNIDPAVFNGAYIPYLREMARIQIYYGGSSSGKSVFLAQRDIIDLMRGGRNFLVCRQVGRTLRGSVIQEIVKVIRAWNLSQLFSINKTDGTITCNANDYQIVFVGLDDVEKLKSITPARGVFTDIRIEEATEIERSSLKQLIKRQRGGDESVPKRLVLSFNPILQTHWVYQEYFSNISWSDTQTSYKSDGLSILKTTYRDNKFLTSDDRRDLENETDPYYYSVYTEGQWGILGNVIFKNWSIQDLSDKQEQFTNRRIGLDFGFSSDPAALFVSYYDRKYKTIYVLDELYETGLTNPELAIRIRELIGDKYLVADSAEPKSIVELQQNGVNAIGAKKGKDSVNFGIQWLQQQNIIIDPRCVNTKNEFMQYKWKEDRYGNVQREPVGKNDHLIDACRYAYEEEAMGETVISVPNPFYT